MTRLVRIELFKARTVRTTYGLMAAVASLTALFASIEASRAGDAKGVAPLFTASGLSTVTTVTGWSMLFAAVFGVLVSSGEFRHGTATLTYLATPNRTSVLTSKALAAFGIGASLGLISAVVSTVVGLVFVASHGYHVALGLGTLTGHIVGAAVGAGLFAAIGVGLGSLVRSQVPAIIAIFMWGLVVESILGGLFTSIRPYLPYTAATTLAGIKLGNAAFGPAHGVTGGSPLPFAAGAGLVVGVVVLIAVVATRTTVSSDIS
jgi:ABC-2 type transport system permease protein